MMLTEVTAVPSTALPVSQFRDHLRLGTGFTDSGLEDGLLETYLRAAAAAVEAWTGKALLVRAFQLETEDWGEDGAQVLPIAPVQSISSVTVADRDGDETLIAPSSYGLFKDIHAPGLRAVSGLLPTIPTGGVARVSFEAGYSAEWSGVPADLGQATMMLAAYYHEYRHEARVGAGKIPYGVTRLISSWRPLRLGGRAR